MRNLPEDEKRLLGLKLPTYRKAYSDRTAWLMACCSELAYLKFETLNANQIHEKFLLEAVGRFLDKDSQQLADLSALIDQLVHDSESEKRKLNTNLKLLNMSLESTYNELGTQAILIRFDQYLVLAYRGTETDSFSDICTDARGTMVKPTEFISHWSANTGVPLPDDQTRVHSGFIDALNAKSRESEETVFEQIQNDLNRPEFKDLPLYITGHSLGGALATLSAKYLVHSAGIAACYTFGAPRIGDIDWGETLKTPVYRVVNSADAVPMLPPGDLTISFIAWLFEWIPGPGKKIGAFVRKFEGYMHHGYMRYLSNVAPGDYKSAKLLYNVSFTRRIIALFGNRLNIRGMRFNKLFSDHSISVYCEKLKHIAIRRNLD